MNNADAQNTQIITPQKRKASKAQPHPFYSNLKSNFFPKLWPRCKLLVNRFIERFEETHTLTWAASIAFYTCFSFAPIILISLTLFSNLGLDTRQQMMTGAMKLFGPQGKDVVSHILDSTSSGLSLNISDTTGFISTLLLIVSSGLIFGELRDALSLILSPSQEKTPHQENKTNKKAPETESSYLKIFFIYIFNKLLFTGLALIFIIALAASVLLSTAIMSILRRNIFTANEGLLFTNIAGSFFIYFTIFTGTFYFIPKTPKKSKNLSSFKSCLFGGFITSFLFIIGKEILGFFLTNSAVTTSYGSLGSIVMLLSWVYYTSLIFFFGAHCIYLTRKDSLHESH